MSNSLIAHAKRVAAQAALDFNEEHHPADDADTVYVRAGLAGCRDAREALPVAALLDALGPAGLRRIREEEGLAVVVEVPGPDWSTKIQMALGDLAAFAQVIVRTGARQDRPTEGNGTVASALSRGASIAGVCHAPARYLPATLVQAADLVVRIGPPSNRVVADVIKAVTGKRARRLPPAVAAGLSFDDITASIRMGTSPATCIARLQASARALSGGDALGEDVPDLASLYGYGAAMSFALALVRDLDEWRAGRLEFSQISKNCTLYSEPGLGKSSLIRSLAKAARVPLVSASVAELFTSSSGHLDGVLKAWEAKVAQAAAIAPSILFLDEIDSIPNRATMDNRARDWWSPFVNSVLASIDSTTSDITSKVIVIGATNHINMLDAALIRPGRLHPVIRIDRPDKDALVGIMRQHLGIDLQEADLSGVAQLGAGSTGAEVTAWIKTARSLARAEGRRMVLGDLIAQVAPAETRTPAEVRAIATHEAAHCVCAARLHVASMTSVTIADRRSSEGAARGIMTPRAFLTKTQLENVAVVALAGRAMDALVGAPHTGAGGGRGSDLDRATGIVVSLHTEFGLGDHLAYRGGNAEDAMRTDPALRRTVEADLLRLYAQATDLVRENRGVIEVLANRLVEARVLSGDEIRTIIEAGSTARGRRRRGGHHAAR
ncbi:ATP-dependent zinc metalloprotease FtsH [Methylobacterium cerastii]|uniref:ATP-dependent zinc metalloprotease FtsH n=4 Tax=Methylobacterium TaxID=407 RepID=A0ABQ4U624_9HYPH|nr:AAA family ATPase [Methylobacterium trifolii]TXN23644.1 AAA family ATPase [Methylobacterium sp. WL19]GJD42349.1 ATP-dependent zinc metalloprotease FtsH [Methylobacterium cerastii]GJE62307.1 ATP-dependent zinc metalloprotease FtsH [Methylobacterium trifolii]